MAGRDPSRFDYLFEPIDGDLEGVGTEAVRVTVPTLPRPRFPVLLAAAVVLGAGLGAGLVSPGPADAVETPLSGTTTVPSRPATTAAPVVESPTPVPTTDPVTDPMAPAPPPASPSPAVPSVRSPQPTPTPSAPEPPQPSRVPAPTPTVRAPLSVSPVPRPAFPNQKPPEGSDDGGSGLLGGLGGLL